MEKMDLRMLLKILLKRWWISVTVVVVFTVTAYILSIYFIKPVYQSNTTLYIGERLDIKNDNQSYNDILMNSQLIKDYREIVKSRLVSEAVINELKLKDITTDSFAAKLGVNLKNDTRVIEITARDEDPKLAMKIANTVSNVFMQKVTDIMKVSNVNTIDSATLPKYPVSPNTRLNIIIAFILGLSVGIGFELLIEYFDNTLKTPEDTKEILNVPVIGTIPIFIK